MIHIKKIILVFIISFLFIAEGNSAIKDSLFATVGNKAITESDIHNEIKTILILTGKVFAEEKRIQYEQAAIQSLVRRNIKQVEIEKRNFSRFNEDDLYKELNYMANNLNMDFDTLKNTFAANDVNFSNVVDQIKTELIWNSMIFELYKNRISVNLDEIDEGLKSFTDKKQITEYLISEIIISPVPKDQLEAEIKKMKNKIKTEGFEKAAMDLSISETAIRGGDLGWVSENVISEEFKSKIVNTSMGNISDPIFLAEGILFFKIRKKRNLKELMSLEDAKNQLVDAEKLKILKMYSLSHYDKLRKTISIKYY